MTSKNNAQKPKSRQQLRIDRETKALQKNLAKRKKQQEELEKLKKEINLGRN